MERQGMRMNLENVSVTYVVYYVAYPLTIKIIFLALDAPTRLDGCRQAWIERRHAGFYLRRREKGRG
jgi:hypothetical protein